MRWEEQIAIVAQSKPNEWKYNMKKLHATRFFRIGLIKKNY